MDLARNLAEWRGQSPAQWIALASRYLPPVVVTVLVLLLALKAADLTWRLLESPADIGPVPPAIRLDQTNRSVTTASFAPLRNWEPFGAAPDETIETYSAEQLNSAPDTTLNLRLQGVTTTNELPERGLVVIPESGLAIIASGRTEGQVYHAGDAIENVGNVTLHSVFVDRVLLDRGGGRLETLRFADTNSSPIQASSRVPQRGQLVQQQQALGGDPGLAIAISEVATQLSEHMQIAPAADGGELIGFRVQPRGGGEVFSRLGLEAGDILTEVNGLPLNDLRQTTRVLQALGESQQANVTVRRNGADIALVLDIGQIQRIAESLQ